MMPAEQHPPANDQPLVNIETEMGLCAALLQVPEMIDNVADLVEPEDFSDEFFKSLFSVILREHAQGHVVTAITLRPFFGADAFPILAQLSGISAAPIGARDFARQIADLAKRRRLIDGLSDVITGTRIAAEPLDKLVDAADTALTQALARSHAATTVTLAQAFDATLKAIDDEQSGNGPQRVMTGLKDFDDLTGGLGRGELMILGGRPSMGKTALALRIGVGSAENGHGTAIESLEMRSRELAARCMTDLTFEYGESCPSFEQVRKGNLGPEYRRMLLDAREKIEKWPLLITDPPTMNIGRLAMEIRRQRRKLALKGQTLDLVIVDYLGLIKGDSKLKRYEEVGEISRTLKQIAKECDVALVVLAQLNRECERREDKRPMLSDLRDAGDIEQDADHVMFVFREEYYLERAEPNASDTSKNGVAKRTEWEVAIGSVRDKMELILAKSRNGKVSKRTCHFFGKHQAVRASDYLSARRGLV